MEENNETNNQPLDTKPEFQKVESKPQDISSRPQVTKPPEMSPKVEDIQQVEVKPKKELLIPILLMLLLIVFGIAIYLGYKYYMSTRQLDKTKEETPIVSDQDIPTSTPESTSSMTTYKNEEYELYFMYPKDMSFNEVFGQNSDNVVITLGDDKSENSFSMKAWKGYPPGQPSYFLDTTPTGSKKIGHTAWNVYLLPIGFNDGHDVRTTPLYVLQKENNSILYTITFPGIENIEPFHDEILSTLKFLDGNDDLVEAIIDHSFNIRDQKYNEDNFVVSVGNVENDFAIGTAANIIEEEIYEGWSWIAKKIDGNWIQIWGGQEVPLCSDIEQHSVPESISSCYAQ